MAKLFDLLANFAPDYPFVQVFGPFVFYLETIGFQPGDYSLKGVGTMQRDEIVALFPELGSEGGLCDYGSARLSLRSHEAKLIT